MPKRDLIEGIDTERSEGEPYESLLRCRCGHLKEKHEPSEDWAVDKGDSFCMDCNRLSVKYPTMWHDFKLDNLSLVEEVAHKRGLI